MKSAFKTLLALTLALFCCGCTPTDDAGALPPLEPGSYTSSAVYFVEADYIWAVDREGRVIAVDNPQDITIASGTLTDSLSVEVQADGTAHAVLDYPFSMRYMAVPVSASAEDAPQVYAQYLLDTLLANGASDAIWDYTLKEVSVVSTQGGRIDFLMTYDLHVARNATAYSGYSPYGGAYGEETALMNQKRAVTIYGAHGQWMTYDPVYFGDRARLDTPRYADFQPEDNQAALFATEQAVYYTEKTSSSAAGTDACATTLYAQPRGGGQRRQIAPPLPNGELRFVDYAEGKLYFSSYYWLPEAESCPGPLYMLDENDERWAALVEDSSLVLSTAPEALYVLHQGRDASARLCAIDQRTAEVRELGALPEDAAGYGVINVKDGRLRLMYNEGEKRVYDISLADGQSQKVQSWP